MWGYTAMFNMRRFRMVCSAMGTSVLTVVVLAFGLTSAIAHDRGSETLTVSAIPAVDDALRLIVQNNVATDHHAKDFAFPEFDNGEDALAALARGDVDVAMTTMLPLARQILADSKMQIPDDNQIVILSTLYNSPEVLSLVLDTSRGIHSAADLMGKTVGYTDSGHREMVLDLELSDLGLSSDDVEALPVGNLYFQRALSNGELDAALVWPELKKRLETRYPGRFITLDDRVVHYNTAVLVTTRKVLAGKPDLLKQYMTELVEAEARILHQPAKINKLVARMLDDPQPRVTRAMARHSFQINLSEATVAALSRMIQWQCRRDACDPCDTPLRERLEPSILSEIKPGAVWMLGF